MSLITIEDFMPTEVKCLKLLRTLRWPEGVRCAWCNNAHIVRFGSQSNAPRYRCRHCRRTFNDRTGTIFEHSQISLREWFYIAWELQRNRSINQISKELGRKYEHVMHAAHAIMEGTFMRRLIALDAEDIEVDEMYIAAGEKGTKQTKRRPRKRGLKLRGRGTYGKDKPPIVAIVERGGKAIVEVVTVLCKKTIDSLLHLVDGRFVHTDDFPLYDHLDDASGIIHTTTNHSKKRYAACYMHSNTVEGLYQGLRHFLDTYKGVCKKNLRLFVSLFQFNYNHRELYPLPRFQALLSTMVGR